MRERASPKPKPGTVKHARTLRRKMTLPEIMLWQELRKRPNSMKFRRQHPCGPYILDFFCADARLAIEIDGETHSRQDRAAHDQNRDAYLLRDNIKTLRIPARDVLQNLEAVLIYIVHEAALRSPLHRPSGGPPPQIAFGEE